ncbi:MAG: hypothetical protein ACTHNS_01200 [Marmoricola sp.]
MAPHLSRDTWTRPLRSEDRWIGVVALLVTAGTHTPLIGEHLEEAPYVGWLFIVLSAASILLAALLVVRDSAAVWFASGATTLLALIAFVLSRTVGLPQIGDDIGNWTEPLGFPAIVAEAVVAVIAYVVLRPRRSPED